MLPRMNTILSHESDSIFHCKELWMINIYTGDRISFKMKLLQKGVDDKCYCVTPLFISLSQSLKIQNNKLHKQCHEYTPCFLDLWIWFTREGTVTILIIKEYSHVAMYSPFCPKVFFAMETIVYIITPGPYLTVVLMKLYIHA